MPDYPDLDVLAEFDELEPTELGFVVTPGEIANRVAAVDRSVQALAANVAASKEPRLNARWRDEWAAFLRRWSVERDSYSSWSARLFATRVMPRVEQYQLSYEWWARDFTRRTGRAPTVPKAVKTDADQPLIPDQVWWIAGGVAALWVVLSTRR